jgi:hypothetical protein
MARILAGKANLTWQAKVALEKGADIAWRHILRHLTFDEFQEEFQLVLKGPIATLNT